MADRDEDNDDDRSSEPPESKARSKRSQDDEDEAPRPAKKLLAKNTRKGAKTDERKPKSSERAKERVKERAKYRAKEPETISSSSLIWIALLAAIALGAWWIFRGQGSSNKEETPSARSETPTAELAPTQAAPKGTPTKTEEPKPEPEIPAASASAAPEPGRTPPPPTAGGGAFDKGIALDALAKSGAKAAGCRMRGESAGTANVTVMFDPSGKVKSAEIRSGPFSGSPTGKCIIRKLMETTIAPFSGEGQVIAPVSVR